MNDTENRSVWWKRDVSDADEPRGPASKYTEKHDAEQRDETAEMPNKNL